MYRVRDSMWVTAASMHMEGNAARWLQLYKLTKGLGNWEQFKKEVLAKFGAYEYAKAMHELLHLRQKGMVAEYVAAFQEARYATAMHNPELDEIFFVTQFMKGLKPEIQNPVLSQLPTMVDKAVLLASIQQDL
ncbi:hypothetical protein QOZ80_6AG0523620 [Eleusine coracana subsp. coracana]|nr:hypothetical protein QOZ80_6AG0523620 [Eleusine coracana subsp. coracana]